MLRFSGRIPDQDGDMLGGSLFEEARLVDICLMTSLEPADIETLRPSQLRQVLDACKKLNRDFFGMLARLASTQGKR